MKIEVDEDQLRFLRSLVRASITKQQKSLARFTPKPGHDPDAFRAHVRASLRFRQGTLAVLVHDPAPAKDMLPRTGRGSLRGQIDVTNDNQEEVPDGTNPG